jgi:APA family basic amino acid/polyamine antiporter
MSDNSPVTGTAPAEAQLRKDIRLPHATAMVVGIIIGASIFIQPSEITVRVPSVSGIMIVWLVSGMLTLFGALVCAELTSAFPRSGGVYVFLRESFGSSLGFLWGWAMFFSMHTGIAAVIAMVFARYFARIVPLDDFGEKSVAVAVILLLSGINLLGVKHGARLQTWFTAGKVIAIALIIAAGFALGGGMDGAALQGGTTAAASDVPLKEYLLAMVAGLFAFGGWHMVTYSAGETAEARRTIPRALMIGTAIVTVSYILLNAVYLYVLPLEQVAASTGIAADMADAILGGGAARAISVLVMFSAFGALAGIILTGPRVYYAMSRDGLIFEWIGRLHPTRKTPDRAIVLQALWATVLVVTGKYSELFGRVIYTEWIFFGLMAIGLVVLRRRGTPRTYSIPGYPLVPVLFAIAAFTIAINKIVSDPGESLEGLGWVAVGIPIYLIWSRKASGSQQPQ